MRWGHRICALLLAACAGPPEPPPRVARAPEAPARMLAEDNADFAQPASQADAVIGPPSRTVPMRFETRRIGPATDETAQRYFGAPVDLDVKDADIHDVMRLLADVGHVNIVVADNVAGRVTVKLKHVPWDQALDVIVIARAKGLGVERDRGVLLIK